MEFPVITSRKLVLLAVLALVLVTMLVSGKERKPHEPLYGFMCEFPGTLRGKWVQSTVADPKWAIKMRVNKQHIHVIDKKFRCIDKHRDMILVKEEQRGKGLTCLGIQDNPDSAGMELQIRKYYPDPAEVRIDWRDDCRSSPERNFLRVEFTRE